MTNQHIVDITIIWPDDKWEDQTENDYLISSLKGVIEHFKRHPIQNRERTMHIANVHGRVFAEIHVSPCRSLANAPR